MCLPLVWWVSHMVCPIENGGGYRLYTLTFRDMSVRVCMLSGAGVMPQKQTCETLKGGDSAWFYERLFLGPER